MSQTLSELIKAIPDAEGRDEILQLGRKVHEIAHGERGSGRDALLETLTERIQWHFRAARYPIPSSDELARMVDDHFS